MKLWQELKCLYRQLKMEIMIITCKKAKFEPIQIMHYAVDNKQNKKTEYFDMYIMRCEKCELLCQYLTHNTVNKEVK